jgi:hypothetical protein
MLLVKFHEPRIYLSELLLSAASPLFPVFFTPFSKGNYLLTTICATAND